jgi:hypothetical protein
MREEGVVVVVVSEFGGAANAGVTIECVTLALQESYHHCDKSDYCPIGTFWNHNYCTEENNTT